MFVHFGSLQHVRGLFRVVKGIITKLIEVRANLFDQEEIR
jgi:hypothetical protein